MPAAPGIRFDWIEDRRRDLIWYLGAPLVGLAIVPFVLAGDRWLLDGSGNALHVVHLAGRPIPVTAAMIVISGWALFLDGPHFWPTLARTVLDPGEWRRRGGILARSFLFFLLGPALVLAPWVASKILAVPAISRSGPALLLVVFVAWAYVHTSRQHWGFFRLYKRRSADLGPEVDRADFIVFHAALFLPPLLFLTSSGDAAIGGVVRPLGRSAPLGAVHLAAWCLYAGTLVGYALWTVARLRRREVSGAKLLYLSVLVPVHLVPFSHPSLALFAPAIVGIGHAVQYQRIVWRYGRRKYAGADGNAAPWSRWAFRNAGVYVLAGLLFTFLLLRGPWVERFASSVGPTIPGGLGTPLVASVFMGWLFQHYWLDARIWRFGADEDLRRHLAA